MGQAWLGMGAIQMKETILEFEVMKLIGAAKYVLAHSNIALCD